MSPLPPWLRHCLQDRIMFWSWSKLQKQSYWHILQNKNRSCKCSEMLNLVPYFSKCWNRNVQPSAIFFQAFSSVTRSFTGSSSQCFETPTTSSLSLMLSFYRINVELIDQVKSNLSWTFPNAAGLPQTNHPKSAQNSEKNNYYQRVLTKELLRTFSFGHLLRQSSE